MGLLTGAIVAPAVLLIGRELALVLFLFVVTICCCCFGVGVAAFVADVVGFVVVVCCIGDVDEDDDDTAADVDGGVAADDNKDGFTVLEIPHMRASVVLTTLRSGLLGSHIFALSSGDIGLLDELLLRLPAACAGDDDDNDNDNCCANT